MSWLASLFSSSKGTVSSRKAMTSTHEAFSLPTSSPSQSSHPDAFSGEALSTAQYPGSSYSYPPPSAGPYYDVPPTVSRSGPTSILPIHRNSLPPLPPYPPLSHTWERLRHWLSKEYPELGDTLNYGILPQDLAQIEMSFGFSLPAPVRESYLCVDGQEPESAAGCSEGLFFGLTLLPLEDVLEEWRFWREVDDDPSTGGNESLREVMQSIPPGWVRKAYSCRGWIPLIADKAGNYLGVDLNPAEGGAVGQVIVFGRDFDTKVVMWRGDGPGGWAKWLASFVEDLESGEGFELGSSSDNEGSEDSVGYESYFFDGVGGGQGDGGGDTGTGGLRLAGEYKGWNVLEAWADRSLRRWQDAGIMPRETTSHPEKGKERKVTPDRLQMPPSGSDSGAEVPIPVLLNEDGETSALASTSTPLGNVTNVSHTSHASISRQPLPSISITKPPAPLPVDLPSPDGLDSPSGLDGNIPVRHDLESGGNISMREIDDVQPAVSMRLPQPPIAASPAPLSSLSSVTLTNSPKPIQSLTQVVATANIPDLLVDDEPVPVPAPTVQTDFASSSGSGGSIGTDSAKSDSPVLISAEDAAQSNTDTTVKLVGGGGVSGAVDESLQDGVLVEEPETAAEVASIRSVDSKSSTRAKHEKKKSSLSSLKKIAQLAGGKRKTDSVSLKGSD